MRIHRKEYLQQIPVSLEQAWQFFSLPQNLEKLTSGTMDFKITTPPHLITNTYAGQIITYRVSPFKGITFSWVTEITHYLPQQYFVDEQRFGPYALWHHEHHFKEIPGGVEMHDILHYAVGYNVFGPVINRLLVGPKINQIFETRQKAINTIFGTF